MRAFHSARSAPAFAILAAFLTLVPGCVTERSASPTHGAPSASRTSTSRSTPSSPVTLPDGPVATPVSASSHSSHVRAALMDLGVVPANGQTLPLVSPDGRFIAVQSGEAPTWPTILAAPGSQVPYNATITAYSLPDPSSANGQPAVAKPIEWAEPLRSVLLGRSADNTGFLIEAPQPDGARWIGHVAWISGTLTWLVQGTDVNAYATLGPDGELAFCRRDVDSISIELVARPNARDAREFASTPPGGGYLFPLFSDEGGIVYAFSLVVGRVELHALKIPQRGDPPNLVAVTQHQLLKNADANAVYRMTASLQTPLPRTLTTESPDSSDRQVSQRFDKLLFYHGGQGRMCVFDRRVGALVALFPNSFAAAPILANEGDPASPRSGYLITTQSSLEYVAWSQRSEFDRSRGVPASLEGGVTVYKSAYIPRLTSDPSWAAVLMGPVPGSNGSRIHLFRLRLEGADGRVR